MLGSPTTPKSKKGVRKRPVMMGTGDGSGLPLSSHGGGQYPHSRGAGGTYSPTSMLSSKARYKTPMERLQNTLRSLLVVSLPLSIFLLPFLLSSSSHKSSQDYPPVVVTLSTTPEKLPFLQPTLESILKQQSLPPTRMYLVVMDPAVMEQDMLKGSKEEYDEKFTTMGFPKESDLPGYLNELVDTTPLEVLQPKIGFGPLSDIVYALQYEARNNAGDDDDDTSTSASSLRQRQLLSRLIYLDDDTVFDDSEFLRQLMDASLEHPQSAVALAGAKLRDRFRQVKPAELNNDKVPNVVQHSWNTHGEQVMAVDIVQAMTGVCVPTALLNRTQILHDILPLLTRQEQDELSHFSSSYDIVVSAIMETLNITRLLVPATFQAPSDVLLIQNANYSANILSRSGKGQENDHPNAMEWMETLVFLQNRLGVWSERTFLDPAKLTATQKQAIECEAVHLSDCESDPDVCLPNAAECPEAQFILSELEKFDASDNEVKASGESDVGGG
ncbi:MAG: hypothetical protein SGILL_007922 [Bacillariaceae sp.]